MKREAIDHTKMKRLCRKLDIPRWQGVGLLESLWHLCAKQTPRGDIGKLSDEDIALGIDYRGNEQPIIDALVHCGWIDRSDTFRLVVHDWPDHCDDSIHMRLARTKQYFVRTDGSFVRPNFSRLPPKDKYPAEQWYAGDSENYETVNKNTKSAKACPRNEDLCAQNAKTAASPATATALAPPEPRPADDTGGGGLSVVGVVVRRFFPATDDGMVAEIATETQNAYAKAVNGFTAPPLSFELIAQAVEQAYYATQRSPGLFRKTAPRVARSWAEEAIRDGKIR